MTAEMHKTLDVVREAWAYHQDWTLGKLLQSAASISRGQLRLNPGVVTDAELVAGLKALIPDEWEEELKK